MKISCYQIIRHRMIFIYRQIEIADRFFNGILSFFKANINTAPGVHAITNIE
jgi:hypothetical protein